jgi:cytochrome c oxidase subunit II
MIAFLALQAHSALQPANADASGIARHFYLLLAVSAVVWVAVVGTAIWAARRHRRGNVSLVSPDDARPNRVIIAATAATVVILFAVLVYDLSLGRRLLHEHRDEQLSIKLTGKQWWWDVEYVDSLPQNRVRTANEIHIPVGRPVLLRLASRDVIHAVWVPNLGIKRDLIPGHDTQVRIQASETGVFRAPCAEYCGLQHAHMALTIVVESDSAFAAWLQQQRQPAPAPAPAESTTSRGRTLFEQGTCATCHSVTGTIAGGRVGPDLTHVASRRSIAAGTLPNTADNLARWITNPHRFKPGVVMPSHTLASADLQALVAYLETLR